MNTHFTRSITVIFFFNCCCLIASAQKEANTWYFGSYAGIDFNSGTATSLADGAMYAFEGCATISDKTTGAILMYTNGASVWNANHQVMANGTGLTGNASSAQAAVIVPDPGNADQYYIFTAGEYFSNGSDGYRYSIVDLSQNGGLGAVTATKNILLYSPACEKLAVIKNSAGDGYWIATHQWTGNNFACYELTAAGISAPVISAAGIPYNFYNQIGCMKFSPDGTRLATVLSGFDQAELYDFDPATGIVSNAMNLGQITNNLPYVYGISFSPGGNCLYVDEENNTGLFQFDLNAGTLADIIASKTVVGNTTGYAMQGMQLAPDGKLYICRNGAQYLAVVNDPDVAGTGCNFVNDGFYLGGDICNYGLPGFTEQVLSTEPVQQVYLSASDTSICEKFCIDFFDLSINNPTAWQWEFPGGVPSASNSQNPANICYDEPGEYDVSLITTGDNGNDTLLLENYITVYATPPFPVITQNGLLLTSSPAAGYQWQFNSIDIPGATNQSYSVTQTGYYTVLVFDENGCKNSTTVYVTLTGTDDLINTAGISIYPNPSEGIFLVESVGGNNGELHLQVVNAIGQLLYDYQQAAGMPLKEYIDLSSMPDAVYFLKIIDDHKAFTVKLLLNR